MSDWPAKVEVSERVVMGVDLGQARDPTAVCVMHREWRSDNPKRPIYRVAHLERLKLGLSYLQICARVKSLVERLPRSAELVIDATGVGRPVFDMFRGDGLNPLGVMITGGTEERHEGRFYYVPKLTLVSRIQALLHAGHLRILKKLPEAKLLVRELEEFRVDYSPTGQLTFNARSGQHDDLVLATAIAAWRLGKPRMRISQEAVERSRQRPLGSLLPLAGLFPFGGTRSWSVSHMIEGKN
jgi:hypothetical protein